MRLRSPVRPPRWSAPRSGRLLSPARPRPLRQAREDGLCAQGQEVRWRPLRRTSPQEDRHHGRLCDAGELHGGLWDAGLLCRARQLRLGGAFRPVYGLTPRIPTSTNPPSLPSSGRRVSCFEHHSTWRPNPPGTIRSDRMGSQRDHSDRADPDPMSLDGSRSNGRQRSPSRVDRTQLSPSPRTIDARCHVAIAVHAARIAPIARAGRSRRAGRPAS